MNTKIKTTKYLGKVVLIAMVTFFLVNTANAQMKIAVLDFKAGAGVGQDDVDGISAIFGTYFINPQKFILVERTQIDRVIREQGFQYSSLTNQQMVRLGEILHIQKMVVGDVNIVSGQYNIDIRLVNAETGVVEATEGTTWARGTSYRDLMQNLARRLMEKIPERQSTISNTTSSSVITLLGYLKVFPEDIGEFKEYPTHIISTLNNSNAHGYGKWRIPTEEEYNILIQNAEKLGLQQVGFWGSWTYMYSEKNGIIQTWNRTDNGGKRGALVRLVTTE